MQDEQGDFGIKYHALSNAFMEKLTEKVSLDGSHDHELGFLFFGIAIETFHDVFTFDGREFEGHVFISGDLAEIITLDKILILLLFVNVSKMQNGFKKPGKIKDLGQNGFFCRVVIAGVYNVFKAVKSGFVRY